MIEAIAVNPSNSNDVFYVTSRWDLDVNCNHLFRSSDGGDHWQAIDTPMTFGGFWERLFSSRVPGAYLPGSGIWWNLRLSGWRPPLECIQHEGSPEPVSTGFFQATSRNAVRRVKRRLRFPAWNSYGTGSNQSESGPAWMEVTAYGHGFGEAEG